MKEKKRTERKGRRKHGGINNNVTATAVAWFLLFVGEFEVVSSVRTQEIQYRLNIDGMGSKLHSGWKDYSKLHDAHRL